MIGAYNEQTKKVLDTLQGKISQKDIIANFFGLRDIVVIAEDGKTILEVINDFVDPDVLRDKGVVWNEPLAKLGVSKEYFDSLFVKYLGNGQRNNPESNGIAPAIEGVADSEKPTRGRKKRAE